MYDITEIFQEIENQLVSSMCRNLSRHIDEEQEADANYPQWQTKQLQALERYRKENLKEFSKQFEDINNGLKKYLEMTYNNSKTATEHDIISNLDRNSDAIGVNQEKLNALIKSVTDDFQKAEYSLLRRSNDLYRQTIYKAQIGLNTGSITLNQAIDMATKDFLSNGINSIRYKNGNLVNIASYSEMALRTAEKRATMYGDGEKRQEWDISTVVVYGHNGACPLCSRWQNRVYIDDVYSNGKPNNKYPLFSVAIQGGLYHPNCKCPPPQTYIEGITEPPTQKAPQELEKDIQNYNFEQVQRYNERQIRKYKRLEANSLDENNRKKYAIKVQEWQSKQREFINAHPETLKRDYLREKVRVLNITEPPKNATDIDKINLTSAQNSGNMKIENDILKISEDFDSSSSISGSDDFYFEDYRYNFEEEYLKNVPKKHKKALLYASDNCFSYARDDENDNNLIYAYSEKLDAFLYNTLHPNFKKYDFNTTYSHELSHYLDYHFFKSFENEAFIKSIEENTYPIQHIENYLNKYSIDLNNLKDNMEISDILSAITLNDMNLTIGHETSYWQRKRNREKEIFVNLFNLEIQDKQNTLNFVKEAFPDIWGAYLNIKNIGFSQLELED